MAPTEENQTHIGFSGTPDFSPEQLRAGRASSLDTRSDIYSLGATLWYLLCGEAPFRGSSVGKVRDALPLEQLTRAHVPEPVVTLLRSMLAVEPEDRPSSAPELLTALQRCQQVIANPSFSFSDRRGTAGLRLQFHAALKCGRDSSVA
jgi:serine/threonine-protein kinase